MAAATREPLAFEVPEGEFQDPPELSRKEYVDLFQDDEMLTRFTRRYGPAHTVELLEKAEEHIDVFCHDRAHDAGRVVYDLFGAVAFILASHECQGGSLPRRYGGPLSRPGYGQSHGGCRNALR